MVETWRRDLERERDRLTELTKQAAAGEGAAGNTPGRESIPSLLATLRTAINQIECALGGPPDAQSSREHELLEEGFEDIQAGRSIEGEEALRWLEEWSAGGPAAIREDSAPVRRAK